MKESILSADCKRSVCPIACTLDVLGDKWTLLVVRDLFLGKEIYSEFQNSPEKIPTNILANRLKKLLEFKIIKKDAYQQHPVRYKYSLTNKGKDLTVIIEAMLQWGERHIPESQARMKKKKTRKPHR
jgi:DNA-binding HxlR family transcriptional regulator